MTKRHDFNTIADLYNFGNRKLANIKAEQAQLLTRWANESDAKLLTIKDTAIWTIETTIQTIDTILEDRYQVANYKK
jgi:hypothetical protein